jgi:hypothetical protein
MYKSIWDLVFKCNDSGIQFSSIQFSQEYSNQRNMRKETQDLGFWTMVYQKEKKNQKKEQRRETYLMSLRRT